MKRKVITIVCVILFMYSMFAPVSAAEIAPPNSGSRTLIYVSDEEIHYPPSEIMPLTYGAYPLRTRITIYEIPSSGMEEKDSELGTYASVASLVLSFGTGNGYMLASTILSVVGIAASEDTYVQARTYISYLCHQKQGEAIWSDETTFTPWVYTGQQFFYKHIMGGKLNSDNKWSTYTHDYTDTPFKTLTGSLYNNSNSWLHDKAYECAVAQEMVIDLPW